MPIILPRLGANDIFSSTAALEAQVGLTGSWEALTAFSVSGVTIARSDVNNLYYVMGYIGDHNIPSDVRRLRKSTFELMRRMGQPVIIKHMYNDRDRKLGLAQESPLAAKAGYGGQTRNRDPFSWGTGFCSVQLSPNEWINPTTGAITTSATQPGDNYVQAPMYRGYGPGFLTFIVEPDTPVDMFKLSSQGAIIKVQSQTVIAGWYPEINDNDLIINVELDNDGYVVDTNERYQAKMSRPITIRGRDNRGRRESTSPFRADFGNRHTVNYQLEMNALPETSILYQVETDR